MDVIRQFSKFTTFRPDPQKYPSSRIVALTMFSMLVGLDLRIVGHLGELPSSLPVFLFPQVPSNLDTPRVILPTAVPLAVVGLLESLMTATVDGAGRCHDHGVDRHL